jgi:ABC-type transport system substrate-binding protein
MAVILQQYLQDVGITAEIIRDEWPEFNAKRYGKKHRHAIIHWNSFYANPMQLFQWFVCDPDEAPYPECLHKFGLSGVNDPVFTENYKKARATFDDAERAQMMQDMELYQLRDVFFATLPNPNVVNIWQPWIGGFQGEGEPGQYQSGALDARTWIVPELR